MVSPYTITSRFLTQGNLNTSQKSLKEVSARHTIEDLSCSGEQYNEAIECLKAWYNRPQLINQIHIHVILETPSLKDVNGNICVAYIKSHCNTFKLPRSWTTNFFGPFITSILELKLDSNTIFKRQRHNQASTGIQYYQELLDFINVRAQASKMSISDKRIPKDDMHILKKVSGSDKFFLNSLQLQFSQTSTVCLPQVQVPDAQ